MRRRVRVPLRDAAYLIPGTVYRERIIEGITVQSDHAVVTLIGPRRKQLEARDLIDTDRVGIHVVVVPTFAELEAPRFRPTVDKWRPS